MSLPLPLNSPLHNPKKRNLFGRWYNPYMQVERELMTEGFNQLYLLLRSNWGIVVRVLQFTLTRTALPLFESTTVGHAWEKSIQLRWFSASCACLKVGGGVLFWFFLVGGSAVLCSTFFYGLSMLPNHHRIIIAFHLPSVLGMDEWLHWKFYPFISHHLVRVLLTPQFRQDSSHW